MRNWTYFDTNFKRTLSASILIEVYRNVLLKFTQYSQLFEMTFNSNKALQGFQNLEGLISLNWMGSAFKEFARRSKIVLSKTEKFSACLRNHSAALRTNKEQLVNSLTALSFCFFWVKPKERGEDSEIKTLATFIFSPFFSSAERSRSIKEKGKRLERIDNWFTNQNSYTI